MLVRTLGALELEGSDLSRPKPLLLLTYLALEGRQTRKHLSELFWLGAANPLGSLSMALTQLRKAAPGAVEADDEQVRATVPCDARSLLDALDAGDVAKALETYGGPFLEGLHLRGWGVELEEWVVVTREFLAARLRAGMIDQAVRDANQGRYEPAAKRAERAWELRGAPPLEPDELSSVHAVLVAGGSVLSGRSRQEAAELGLEVPTNAEAAREHLLRATGNTAASQLPAYPTGFIGRKGELRDVAGLLEADGKRLVTLLGPGGVGKTRLALKVASDQLWRGSFPGGTYFAPLETLTSPGSVVPALSHAVGLEPESADEGLAPLVDRLSGSDTLLVIDNFEHLTEAAPSLSELLTACPSLRMLVTSRERLNLQAEQAYAVGGLDFPAENLERPEDALIFDAVELFVRRARRTDPDFTLSSETLPAVVRICRLVEGLPLALELAAVWVRAVPVADIADDLARGIEVLSTPARDVSERHGSMQDVLEHSWRSLDEAERRTLRALSVFGGGFRRLAAAEVAGAGIPMLGRLADKSLLRVSKDRGRLDLHPLVQAFAAQKLDAAPEESAAVRRRHAGHYLEMVTAWAGEARDGDADAALGAFAAERVNVAKAVGHAIDAEQAVTLSEVLDPLRTLFDMGKRFTEGVEFFGHAAQRLDRSDAFEPVMAARARTSQAWLAHLAGDAVIAREVAERALVILRDADVPLETGKCLNVLASIAWSSGDFAAASSRWAEARGLAEGAGADGHVASYAANGALADHSLGEYGSARRNLEAALDAFRRLHDTFHVIRTLNKLGVLLLDVGDLGAAQARIQEGVALAERHGLHEEVPRLKLNLAVVAFDRRDLPTASALTREAMAALRDGDDRSLMGYAEARLGWVAAAQGDEPAARSHFERAVDWAPEAAAVKAEVLGGAALLAANLERDAEAVMFHSVLAENPAVEHPDRQRHDSALGELRGRLRESDFLDAVKGGTTLELDAALDLALGRRQAM